MTIFNYGDIVLVPFPFTNQSNSKKRPAVVISSKVYNKTKLDIIVMVITSQIKPAQGMGEFSVSDWKGAGLLKPSAVKPVITTLEKQLVISKLGRLKEADQDQLGQTIEAIFG